MTQKSMGGILRQGIETERSTKLTIGEAYNQFKRSDLTHLLKGDVISNRQISKRRNKKGILYKFATGQLGAKHYIP